MRQEIPISLHPVKRRKKDLLQPDLDAKNEKKIRVARGASCLLRGRGLKGTGEDEKSKGRDGKHPLVVHEYGVLCCGQRNKKRTPNRSWLEVQDTMKIKD